MSTSTWCNSYKGPEGEFSVSLSADAKESTGIVQMLRDSVETIIRNLSNKGRVPHTEDAVEEDSVDQSSSFGATNGIDALKRFVETKCCIGPDERFNVKDFYSEYANFCLITGATPLKNSHVIRELNALYSVTVVGSRHYKSIAFFGDRVNDETRRIIENGAIKHFVENYAVVAPERTIRSTDFYKVYKEFCGSIGRPVEDPQVFYAGLRSQFRVKVEDRSHGRTTTVLIGIDLKEEHKTDCTSDGTRKVPYKKRRSSREPDTGPTIPYRDRLDLRKADVSQIAALPGMTSSKAHKIFRHITSTKIKKVSDILAADGIGRVTYQKIKNYVKVVR